MIYQKIQPSPKLKPYIQWFFFLEHDQWLHAPFEIKSSANCSHAMVFNYGTQYKLYNHKYYGKMLPKTILSGVTLSHYKLRYKGNVMMAGVIFNGTSYQDVFDIPPYDEWIDDRLNLEDIIGLETHQLNEQLATAFNTTHRVAILESWFENRLKKRSPERPLIDYAVDSIIQNRGMIKIYDVAAQIGFSPRQLRRKFKERMGIGPKTFARMKRFNYVHSCLARNFEDTWTCFLEDGAYYDQSHFIKDYIEFSGEIPSEFIHRSRSIYDEIMASPMAE